jgi:hypothetical protein
MDTRFRLGGQYLFYRNMLEHILKTNTNEFHHILKIVFIKNNSGI